MMARPKRNCARDFRAATPEVTVPYGSTEDRLSAPTARFHYGEYRLQTEDETAGTYPSTPGNSTVPPA